jgi:hypothetical protein
MDGEKELKKALIAEKRALICACFVLQKTQNMCIERHTKAVRQVLPAPKFSPKIHPKTANKPLQNHPKTSKYHSKTTPKLPKTTPIFTQKCPVRTSEIMACQLS